MPTRPTRRLGRVSRDQQRVARPRVRERIVAELRGHIERGELAAGDRLPAERELAIDLGVSRTTLREALHSLQALGLVEVAHGRGVFIRGQSMLASAQHLSESVAMQEGGSLLSAMPDGCASEPTPETIQLATQLRRLRELFEIRRVLEGAGAAWAAERATTEQLAQMRELLRQSEEVFASEPLDVRRAGAIDAQLHALIAASAANQTLVRLMATLLDELTLARERSLAIPGRARRSSGQHARIVAAIVSRDAQSARERMLEHIRDVEQALLVGQHEFDRGVRDTLM